jgi:hypothetical protein
MFGSSISYTIFASMKQTELKKAKDIKVGDEIHYDQVSPYGKYISVEVVGIRQTKARRFFTIKEVYQSNFGEIIESKRELHGGAAFQTPIFNVVKK